MAATDTRVDPFRGFNFRIEIDGIGIGAFTEVGGLTADGDAVDYREGTDAVNHVRKLIGLVKSTNIVLKTGYMSQHEELWRWKARIAAGEPDRRNGSVVLMNEAHKDVMRWNFENAWPCKIEGPSMKASGNEVAIMSMELVHEGLTLEIEA